MIYLVTRTQELFEHDHYTVIGVEESLQLLKPLYVVGLDTETEGLDCHTNRLKTLQLGCKDFQVVIDCLTVDVELYKEFLESDRWFVGWNLKFDLKFLYKHGIYPPKVYDGFLAEKLLWLGYPAGQHSLSLKAAGEHYLGIELDKTVRGKITWAGLTTDVIEYAANDVKYLQDIMEKQWQMLVKKNLTKAIKLENKFVLPLAYMEFCGIKLDIQKWKAKMQKDLTALQSAKQRLDSWVAAHFPEDPRFTRVNREGDLWTGFDLTPKCIINWDSPLQVIPLFKLLGFNLNSKDKKTGNLRDSIDAKIIEPQKHISDIATIYLEYKAAAKVVGTYGQNFLDQVNTATGRIYSNFRQMGADTTRIASGGKDKGNHTEYVNLLSLPSDAETRACFVAEEGNKWISIDYTGQETFLMASIADDKAIIKELMEGSGDIHSLTAYIAFKEIPRDTPIKDIKKKYHSLRQNAKGIEFAINYGGNANTIHQNKGIPIEEANEIYNNYMSGFSGLKKYQDFRRKDWFDKGYILLSPITEHKAFIFDFTELKKLKESFSAPNFWEKYRDLKINHPDCQEVENVKHFFKRKSDMERASINYPIQAAGSFCLRYAMIEFFEYLRTNNLFGKVLINVTPYDEINCEAPEDIAEEIATVVHRCMVNAGKIFCTRCSLDAEVSRLENGELPNYWIH